MGKHHFNGKIISNHLWAIDSLDNPGVRIKNAYPQIYRLMVYVYVYLMVYNTHFCNTQGSFSWVYLCLDVIHSGFDWKSSASVVGTPARGTVAV